MLGNLAAVDVDHYLPMGHSDSDPPACQLGRSRVVNIAHTAETVPTHPHLDTTTGIRQRMQVVLLDCPAWGHLGTHSAVVTLERHLLGPTVILGSDICDRTEGQQREERALQIADSPLNLALRVRTARQQNDRAKTQRPGTKPPPGHEHVPGGT